MLISNYVPKEAVVDAVAAQQPLQFVKLGGFFHVPLLGLFLLPLEEFGVLVVVSFLRQECHTVNL